MAGGVIYSHAVKAFIDHARRRAVLPEAALTQHFTEQGIDPRRPKNVSYDAWLATLRGIARETAGTRTLEESLQALGELTFEGYVESIVGRAMLLAMRLRGAERSLMRLASSYATADTVTRVSSRRLGPNHLELDFEQGVHEVPTFVRGILLASLRMLGVEAPRLDYVAGPGERVVFTARWS
jgi:uncharacterized protein (TIGR02265 family)